MFLVVGIGVVWYVGWLCVCVYDVGGEMDLFGCLELLFVEFDWDVVVVVIGLCVLCDGWCWDGWVFVVLVVVGYFLDLWVGLDWLCVDVVGLGDD